MKTLSRQAISAARGLSTKASRREFLRFLLGSPLLLSAAGARAGQGLAGEGEGAGPEALHDLLIDPDDAINVFDFRTAAHRALSPAHFAYVETGVDHEVGIRANREGFDRFGLRPRRLVDVRDLDTAREVLGTRLSCPILLCPAGLQRAFHPDGELAVARAARREDHLQILSTASSASLEEVAEARGAPLWFQLYTPRLWALTRRQLTRAQAAGCTAIVLTVDVPGFGSQDRVRRFDRDHPSCQSCHGGAAETALSAVAGVASMLGSDLRVLVSDATTLDWEYVDRIRDATSVKLLLKGILTHEDASLCVEHGVDGLIVSNHGARQIDNSLSTIEVLPEIVRAVEGRIPVLIDSGFRRGSDIFKALALGASAVCVGRPYLWGLAAFGQRGVEAVLAILRREFETTMRNMGTRTLAEIGPACVQRPDPRCTPVTAPGEGRP